MTGKREIDEAIIANNQVKYQQFHTPFMQSPLREEYGFKGITTAAQTVLGGVYQSPQHLDPYVKALLEEFAIPQAVQDLGPLQMTLPLETYQDFWKKAKENTSRYPAELFFTTMKAGATDEMISTLECDLLNC
jgi:hypothetical protein